MEGKKREIRAESKGGRPPKKDSEKLTKVYRFRVTEEQDLKIQNRAKKKGVSESDLIRSALFSPTSYSSDPFPFFKLLASAKNLREHIAENENKYDSSVSVKLLKILKDIETLIETA